MKCQVRGWLIGSAAQLQRYLQLQLLALHLHLLLLLLLLVATAAVVVVARVLFDWWKSNWNHLAHIFSSIV